MALYNGGFPASYQQYYPQYQMPQVGSQIPSQQQNNNSIIWVQGEAGAKSYLVAPNTTVQLWDSEQQTIYLKSADASGMPSIKTLDYTIRQDAPRSTPQNVQSSTTDVHRSDLDALQSQIDALKDEFRRYKEEEYEQSTL